MSHKYLSFFEGTEFSKRTALFRSLLYTLHQDQFVLCVNKCSAKKHGRAILAVEVVVFVFIDAILADAVVVFVFIDPIIF